MIKSYQFLATPYAKVLYLSFAHCAAYLRYRVWLSNDRANQSSMMEYATEYLDHGVQVSWVYLYRWYCRFCSAIWAFYCHQYFTHWLNSTSLWRPILLILYSFSKVGAVDIDSGWSTGFNNFIFDTDKYPNASAMVLKSDPTIELHF